MKFDDLLAAEPELMQVLSRAELSRRKSAVHRQAAYETAKRQARPLVGCGAKNQDLQSDEAWECFVKKVSRVLRL